MQLTSFDLCLLSRSKFVLPKVMVPILLPEFFCSIYIEGWLDFFVRSANQVRANLRSGLGDWYRITSTFLTSQKHLVLVRSPSTRSASSFEQQTPEQVVCAPVAPALGQRAALNIRLPSRLSVPQCWRGTGQVPVTRLFISTGEKVGLPPGIDGEGSVLLNPYRCPPQK